MLLKIGAPSEHGFGEPLGLLSDCHRRIEYFLNVLSAITDQAKGQRLNSAQERDLQRALTYFATAAPKHTADEEESLFPRLAASAHPDVTEALVLVKRLERDHQEADLRHRAVDALGRKWIADETLSEADAIDLRHHLARLSDIYRAHIAAEDQQLFPAAARILTQTELQSIGLEMAERRSLQA